MGFEIEHVIIIDFPFLQKGKTPSCKEILSIAQGKAGGNITTLGT